jgi:outer membrane protein assembly factor BamB
MKLRTGVALAVVVAVLGATAGLALFDSTGGDLRVEWRSDTAVEREGNHHAVAVGEGFVYAPVSGRADTRDCALLALDADSGERAWTEPVALENCTAHALADPAIADRDGDGDRELLVATTERDVRALDPASGDREWTAPLDSYGYTKPVVADLGGGRAVVVADAEGTVHVFRGGDLAWTHSLDGMVWAQPTVADFDADGSPELVVGHSRGVAALDGDGSVAWDREVEGSVTWQATGGLDDDTAREVVVATTEGVVAALDGRDGSLEWERDLGRFAAVAVADGDGDGIPEVYATAADGVLRAFAADGTREWSTTLTGEHVQMTPPPALGDLDGDGSPEIAAVTNDGLLRVVDPADGSVLATHERRDAAVFTHAAVGDADRDGTSEVYVIYGDGTVVALSYEA